MNLEITPKELSLVIRGLKAKRQKLRSHLIAWDKKIKDGNVHTPDKVEYLCSLDKTDILAIDSLILKLEQLEND